MLYSYAYQCHCKKFSMLLQMDGDLILFMRPITWFWDLHRSTNRCNDEPGVEGGMSMVQSLSGKFISPKLFVWNQNTSLLIYFISDSNLELIIWVELRKILTFCIWMLNEHWRLTFLSYYSKTLFAYSWPLTKIKKIQM